MEKAGWDCLRHYEIIGNGTIPYFHELEDCPPDTLHSFPKELILETNKKKPKDSSFPLAFSLSLLIIN